jgi:septal ring factor EnvC (AmiA/AmiB activator)
MLSLRTQFSADKIHQHHHGIFRLSFLCPPPFMAESQASDSIGGALDTLDQFIQASTTLRAEVGRLTEELRTTSDERSSLRERLRTMSAALDLEKWARRKAQDELSVLKGSVDLREEQMRADEEEIGRHQKDLAQQLKKMGETVDELVTSHGRRISRGSSQLVPERAARPRPSAFLDIAYGAVLTSTGSPSRPSFETPDEASEEGVAPAFPNCTLIHPSF